MSSIARSSFAALAVATALHACTAFSSPEASSTGDGGSGTGDSGHADATGDEGNPCRAELSKDTANCGRCGHDCGGGACQAGSCQPVLVASGEVDLGELRVAGDRLLYRAGGSVRAVGLNGGFPTTLVPCANRAGLAVTSAGFYSWCNGALTLRDVADGAVRASATADGYEAAAGGDWFFFREATTYLYRTPASLGTGKETTLTTAGDKFRSLAATSSQLFFMTGGGDLFVSPLASGGPTQLEAAQAAPSGIAADDRGVFWATASDTAEAVLHARLVSGGASSSLATGLDHPDRLAVDASDVYITARGTPPSYSNGAILRVSRGGGAVAVLASGVAAPHEIVATDRFVVWTILGTSTDAGYTGGAIYRLAK